MVPCAPILPRLPDDNYYHPAPATVKPLVSWRQSRCARPPRRRL